MIARHTKIVATLGPATDDPEVLDRLVAAGVNTVRINCSHGTHEDMRKRARAVREASERAGRPVGVLFDLQGPKLRLNADIEARTVEPGEEIVFSGRPEVREGVVRVDFEDFDLLVTDRSELVVGDGVPRFLVERVEAGEIHARAIAPGPLSARKGINVTYARPNLPAITEKDIADLEVAVELEADFVALSFVRSAADVEDLRARLRAHGSEARTIAKIEKIEAYEHLDEILAVSDAVMVARGDYGIEAGVSRVPLMQKDTIKRATQAGKAVITATQMLESMLNSPEPTRAEATDVANAVIDGTSAVMLSGETSVGKYPVEAVRAMSEIAVAAEDSPIIHGAAHRDVETLSEAVLRNAVELAAECDAAALIVPTASGGGARACSKYRLPRPIVALAYEPRVARQLTLEWGVKPCMMRATDTVDELIDEALATTKDFARFPPGTLVVLTGGQSTHTAGATTMIMVREIP